MITIIKDILGNGYGMAAAMVGLAGAPLFDFLATRSSVWFYASFFGMIIILLLLGFNEERKRKKFYTTQLIPIPIVIKVGDGADPKVALTQLINIIEKDDIYKGLLQNLSRFFSIDADELTFEMNCDIFNEQKILAFVQIIRDRLNLIDKRMKENVIYHIAYYGRPSVGFAVGSIFSRDGLCIYQKNDHSKTFDMVAKIDSRKYKEKIQEFSKYAITECLANSTDPLLIVLNSASHNVNTNAISLKDYNNKIIINAKTNGTIDVNEDWTLYAQEIYNIINQYRFTYSKILLAHSMPEAISIIVGMAIENYWDITIMQYKDSDQIPIYSMNHIRYFDF
jgi:hypothetical protein